jgi:hypothetical protein
MPRTVTHLQLVPELHITPAERWIAAVRREAPFQIVTGDRMPLPRLSLVPTSAESWVRAIRREPAAA